MAIEKDQDVDKNPTRICLENIAVTVSGDCFCQDGSWWYSIPILKIFGKGETPEKALKNAKEILKSYDFVAATAYANGEIKLFSGALSQEAHEKVHMEAIQVIGETEGEPTIVVNVEPPTQDENLLPDFVNPDSEINKHAEPKSEPEPEDNRYPHRGPQGHKKTFGTHRK